MNYCEIKYNDIANGPGVRTILFVSGCRNRCPGCFQPQTWDFEYGNKFTDDTIQEILESLKPDYIRGLTLLGGDPMEEENQEGLIPLLEAVRKEYKDKDIWAWTGYILDRDLVEGGAKYCKHTPKLLSLLDVLVDGPFIEEKKDLMLKFRGSTNQRIIDIQEYNKTGQITFWEE